MCASNTVPNKANQPDGGLVLTKVRRNEAYSLSIWKSSGVSKSKSEKIVWTGLFQHLLYNSLGLSPCIAA